MAVTILERPKGYTLSSSPVTFNVVDAGGGYAGFQSGAHGLSSGDIVYITSFIEQYNGFVQVEPDSANSFYIHPLGTSVGDVTSRVEFIQTITQASGDFGEYYISNFTHGWSAVHLPITYRLSSDLYPTNSVDTTRNVSSVQDANGYTVILLSGSLGSAVNSYDFVKLTLPSDTELSKVYQILEFISPTVMIINLEYDSGNNFTGATALKHYNNYNILVRVYAGINASHQWASEKPYELAATLQFIPDDNNEAFFSINEILKSYIETRNNLVLGTLPNNIDFWTNFYIEVAESYDDSDGYTFGTTTTNYTSDQSNFEGTAVNAKLEFKNIYSGYLSAYLMTNNTAKFLTLFTIPVLFSCGDDTPDCYTDVSFMLPAGYSTVNFIQEYYLNGNSGNTVTDVVPFTEYGGVFRHELTLDCAYERVDVRLESEDDAILGDFSTAVQEAGPSVDWTNPGGGLPAVVTLTAGQTSEKIGFPYNFVTGRTYDLTALIDQVSAGGSGTVTVTVFLYNTFSGTFSGLVDSHSYTYAFSQSFELTASSNADYIVFQIVRTGGAGSFTYTILSAVIPGEVISETKQFLIDCDCANQEIRLTWLNNLAGFDYWAFTAEKDHIREIQEVMTTKKNILPTWPKSYGTDADTIRKQTKRVSNKAYTVRSQFLTSDQADALSYIKSSILVQIINSRTDRRTVIVDSDSFIVRKDGDDTFEIAFNISFTDDIPVQT